MAGTSDGRSFRTAIFIRQSSDEQRNVTPIFILNYLHSPPPLSFLTEICNLLFVKQIPHNRAYIDHEKYVSAWFLVAPNTRIKRNRRNGERRRNWNEIITLKATGFRRRAGMDKKKKKETKLFQRNKRKRCRSLSGKMHATISRIPRRKLFHASTFSPSLSNFRLSKEREREKELAIPREGVE